MIAEAKEAFTILVVDDEISILNSLKRLFRKTGYRILLAEDGRKGLELLESTQVDLMLLDLKMPGMDGFEVLERALECRPALKIIIQTGHGGVQEAVKAVQKGALDFLVKGEALDVLNNRIRQVYEHWQLEQENLALRRKDAEQFEFDRLIGESPPMVQLKKLITRVAPTDSTVLIQGETGTGKELIAQALHHHSERRDKPFVAIDCASISESVLESELFGHERGAFTGADAPFQGVIRSADKGTLFLDEIGEISTSVQAKLLRAIQERSIRPVGSTRFYKVDVRIIAATNKILLNEVANAAFRQDLYYRLSTVTLTAPPLRKRENDIFLLTEYFLEQCSASLGRRVQISDEVHELFARYEWPGNIRELDNVLRGAAVFSDGGVIEATDLPQAIRSSKPLVEPATEPVTLEAMEKEAIRKALALSKNNRKEARKILAISEATLYRKIKKYNL
ncbi:two component, sigma54 specific, transcriptional regulator, Fis family [Desulfobulbus propionicus DSM 2032]|uniref:Two component, sigma54 specific, transcriptional regulator, Fis family n=1 Tax=Desulfobulbus propionicus (strain ATCC 33891 / DSM 2032 / VKM B-1956 / 1pr3) TaxID=577650 RepID=A0A7U4DMU0_DESPD|nr:sigma-54 dependent transcriptional regulator [Desulfobulbus propionicus]ADW16316.1 two component, sigma54 specific, transcriptional regulator, Fis family [Desulfobulbus propionicus DSM 2032]